MESANESALEAIKSRIKKLAQRNDLETTVSAVINALSSKIYFSEIDLIMLQKVEEIYESYDVAVNQSARERISKLALHDDLEPPVLAILQSFSGKTSFTNADLYFLKKAEAWHYLGEEECQYL